MEKHPSNGSKHKHTELKEVRYEKHTLHKNGDFIREVFADPPNEDDNAATVISTTLIGVFAVLIVLIMAAAYIVVN